MSTDPTHDVPMPDQPPADTPPDEIPRPGALPDPDAPVVPPAVAASMDELATLDALPLGAHVEAYERMHEQLSSAIADSGGRRPSSGSG